MVRIRLAALALVGAGAAAAAPCVADEPKSRAPSAEAKGEVYESKTADGLAYRYVVPADYDGDRGANLVFVLHGNNLDRTWGFEHHPPGQFRPRDIVVCPDGTRASSAGGFNFMQADKDSTRLHALHLDLRKTLVVKETYLYGHDQAGVFALFYAGQYPDFVRGVVLHASGGGLGAAPAKKHHGMAIGFMHGSADPVVPYVRSVDALSKAQENGQPHCRLRTLIDGSHAPDWKQTAQMLAWCKGVASKDSLAVESAFDELLAVPEAPDVVARYLVARRVVAETFCSAAHKEQARATIAAVDKTVAAHVAALEKAMKDRSAWKLEAAPAWLGHAQRFLREYQAVPACEAFRKTFADQVRIHDEEAQRAWKDYEQFVESDPQRAFAEGIDLVAKAYLAEGYVNSDFLAKLKAMKDEAKKLKIPATTLKLYDKAIPPYEAALKKGNDEFMRIEKASS